MVNMRSAVASRRQFLTVGGVALAGAVLSRNVAADIIKDVSANWGGGPTAAPPSSAAATPSASATATPMPTPVPTPATVTIPVPVFQQSMVLDCETAALQQGLAYYGINVSQPEMFARENADTRLPEMGANHTVLRWSNPYKNFVGYVNGSDAIPTGYGVYWPVILGLAQAYGLPNTSGGEAFNAAARSTDKATVQP